MDELAQVNVARLRGSAELGPFLAAADPVYRLAEASRGFVWRHTEGHGHRPLVRGFEVVNLSVWRSYEDLHAFVYRSSHGGFVRRRAEWFRQARQPSTALWWVPAGHRPELDEALARIAVLCRDGPSPRAFTPRRRYDPDGLPIPARPGPARRRAGAPTPR